MRKNATKISRQEITRIRVDMYNSRLLHEKYLAEKEAYEMSEQGIAEREKRQQQQSKYLMEESKREAIVAKLQELRVYLFNHILQDLGIENKPQQNANLDIEKVTEVMRKYEPNIKYLEKNCFEFEKMQETRYTYQFVKLYKDLIAVNHIFIEFAPVMAFYNANDILQSVGLRTFVSYKETFAAKGFFDDEIFAKVHKDRFTGFEDLSTLTDYTKVKKELIASPELYPYINQTVKDTIFVNKMVLRDLLYTVPEIVYFMTDKEMLLIGDVCTGVMGRLIINNPTIMLVLPKHYFRVHGAKFVFASFNKNQIHAAVSKYYDLQPELKEYMQSYIDKLGCENTTETKTEVQTSTNEESVKTNL